MMKCAVIYFSQTGNTEKIAQCIQAGIKQAAGRCDLFKIRDADPKNLYQYDLIGIGSPVMGGETPNVSKFINDMRGVGGKHVFAFCTHGTMREFFPDSIYPKLKNRGLTVIGYGDWYGSLWLSSYPKPYLTDGHPDEIDLADAQNFGIDMVERSRRITAGETDLIPPPPPKPNPVMPPDWVDATFQSSLQWHPEKCNYTKGCRLCMDNCPMDGIDLTLDPPVIGDLCISCDFCTKICPTGAMDGDDFFDKTWEWMYDDLMDNLAPELAKQEAEGIFRRIIPLDQVKRGSPFYQVYNQHPRWIIGQGPAGNK